MVQGRRAGFIKQLDRWAPAVHVWGAVGMNYKLLIFIDEKISSGVYVRALFAGPC